MTEIDSLWQQIKDHLDSERHRIVSEIRDYPRPIPACDAQFNYLLEERQRVGDELQRLEAARDGRTGQDAVTRVLEFVATSPYFTGELGQRIRTSLPESTDG